MMIIINFVFFFSGIVFKVYSLDHDFDVHTFKYTVDNFNEEVAKKHHFVMFYAPWCGHCKNLAPTWGQLAEMLNEEDSNIGIAVVDCTTDAKVCADQDVTGYPTLKFFRKGQEEGVRFKGTRDLPTLTNFINEQLRESDESHPDMERDYPLIELTDDNFHKTIEQGKAFVKFYAPWCGHCQRLAPTWLELAKAMEFNEEITIGKIDCTIYRDICSDNDVKGYPTLLWFENGQKIEKYTGERSLQALKNYVGKMSGESEKLVKSEKTQTKSTMEEPVLVLSADTFEGEVKTGLTFVDFYSPWCGHCKRLAPTWELLGKKFQNTNGVKIAKVDCTESENKSFCNDQEIEGFPSLFLYKDGQKISEYNGNRELEDMYEFVQKHRLHEEL